MGPGKGTLMKDILLTSNKFKDFAQSINIHMVELSKTMRNEQYYTLQCNSDTDKDKDKDNEVFTSIGDHKIPIKWHSFLNQIPSGTPTLYIGQEFLDAFPVHQFVYTTKGWRERMIDIDYTNNSEYHFRMVLAPGP